MLYSVRLNFRNNMHNKYFFKKSQLHYVHLRSQLFYTQHAPVTDGVPDSMLSYEKIIWPRTTTNDMSFNQIVTKNNGVCGKMCKWDPTSGNCSFVLFVFLSDLIRSQFPLPHTPLSPSPQVLSPRSLLLLFRSETAGLPGMLSKHSIAIYHGTDLFSRLVEKKENSKWKSQGHSPLPLLKDPQEHQATWL